MSKTAKLSFDDGMYWFNGLLSDLKCFVDETLGLKGNWTSPGGDIKLFKTANSELLSSGTDIRKKLIIQDDKALFEAEVCEFNESSRARRSN